ncbi:unnamed protein product [Mytilus edulis]|uniref:Uncharacterized protein n=1 Tax=Mytilus edulis TaxID=6550 RepID=A0A8S3TDA5_MYTED|nr:unnamed protein product [Mytilus edulis]
MVSDTEISYEQPSDILKTFQGGQDKTEPNIVSDTEISYEQPSDILKTFHGGQDKTETNMVSDTEISYEQPSDILKTFHGGQDKTEPNMVSDTEQEKYTNNHPSDQTSTDQLMNYAYTCKTREMIGVGNTSGKECLGNVCGKQCQGKEETLQKLHFCMDLP